MEDSAKSIQTRPETYPTGFEILHNPHLNKGTAFTEAERDQLKIRGLVPARVLTQDQQLGRIMENFRGKSSPLEKYIFLIALQDRNEQLFYRTVMDHLEEKYAHALPTIVITADRSPELEEIVRKRGYGLLRKPIRPAALRALMTNTLKNL